MKAGSLPDDDAVALRACRASPSSGEVCLEVSSRYVSLCLHLFLAQKSWNRDLESSAARGFDLCTLNSVLCSRVRPTNYKVQTTKFKVQKSARVAEQQRHLTVNQAFIVNFVGASPSACTRFFLGM